MKKTFPIVFVVIMLIQIFLPLKLNAEEEMNFSEEEQALIEESKNGEALSIGIIPGTFPMSDYNKETGEFSGITIELLDLISKKTGLKLRFEPIDLEENAPIASLKAGNTDLVAGVLKTENFQNDTSLVLSERLVNSSVVFVGRKGETFINDEDHKTVAIINGFQVGIEYIQNNFPNYTIVNYDTSEACLDAVASGEADLNLNVKYIVAYLLQDPHYANLERTSAFSFNMDTCVAGISGKSETAISIIDKGLNSITEDEYNYILMDFTIGNAFEMSFSDLVYKYRTIIALMGMMLLIIIICIILLFKIRSRNIKRIKKSNEQLKEALNIAQRANEAKSLFTSRMSHEIRTPLNAVIGYLTIATNNISNQEKVEYCLGKSEIAARHLLGIINDVLDFSSIDSGKIKISKEKFDIKGIISVLSAMFYPQAKDKGVDFEISIENLSQEELIGDGMRFNQIMVNLISNAVKFTPKGGRVSLLISESLVKDNLVFLKIRVIDTGIGISDEFKEKIFSPFEQQDSSITKTFGGTGLGLSITKSLVGLMEGTISMESKWGEGTVFEVEIPFGRVQTNKENVNYDFSKIKVLIVDDHDVEAEYLRIILEQCGVKGHKVNSGEKAIKEIIDARERNEEYNICLIDWKMAGMDGLELSRKIRELKIKYMPIVIVSAYDFSDIKEEAKGNGVDYFITKPIFKSNIFDMLISIYGKKKEKYTDEVKNVNFRGRRVLLAEDNDMNMEIATEILKSSGLRVEGARNGKDAVDKFLASSPGYYGMIFMDVQMPVLSGYDATRAIRASEHPDAKTVPIIAMSAYAFSEDISEALASGMTGHVSKPIDIKELFGVIKKFLK